MRSGFGIAAGSRFHTCRTNESLFSNDFGTWAGLETIPARVGSARRCCSRSHSSCPLRTACSKAHPARANVPIKSKAHLSIGSCGMRSLFAPQIAPLYPGFPFCPPDGPFIRDFHFARRIRAFTHQHASPHARFLHRTLFRSQLPSGGAALDGKPTGAPAFRVFLRHRSTRVPCLRRFVALASWHRQRPDPPHSGRASASWHRQRPDPPQHVAEQPPGQMPLCQQEPVVPRMLHQPAPGFH